MFQLLQPRSVYDSAREDKLDEELRAATAELSEERATQNESRNQHELRLGPLAGQTCASALKKPSKLIRPSEPKNIYKKR